MVGAGQQPDSEDQAVVLTSRSCQLLAKYKKSRKQLENEAGMCAVKVPTM